MTHIGKPVMTLFALQEYEMKEALDHARKEQKLLKIVANRDYFESSSQVCMFTL